MPIWTTILSAVVLGEALTRIRIIAFLSVRGGPSVLLWPLFSNGFPPFVFIRSAAH